MPVVRGADRVIVLADVNTAERCVPIVGCRADEVIVVPAGDENKTIEQLQHVWNVLIRRGATRQSVLVCIGGGMVTDLGGLAAATYMRGMPYVNVPTTLLAAVDAATGGKTAVNYGGMKNMIGVFAEPRETVICTELFRTLDYAQRMAGMAEMVKHGLLADREMLGRTLAFDTDRFDTEELLPLVKDNIELKERIVEADPYDTGVRRALNLGHTIGHAIESRSQEAGRGMLHGHAVMWGLVGELYLSMMKLGFDRRLVSAVSAYAREYYPRPELSCKDYDRLSDLMRHDKKNHHDRILFTLLAGVGEWKLDCEVTEEEIKEALDFMQ